MENVTLPSGPQTCAIGVSVNNSLEMVTLPSGLQTFAFGLSVSNCLEGDRAEWLSDLRYRHCCARPARMPDLKHARASRMSCWSVGIVLFPMAASTATY